MYFPGAVTPASRSDLRLDAGWSEDDFLAVVGGVAICPDQQLLGLIDSAVAVAVGNYISVASERHACEQGRGETLLESGNHGDDSFVEQCHGRAVRCPLYNSCHIWVMLCGGVVSVLYIYLVSAR